MVSGRYAQNIVFPAMALICLGTIMVYSSTALMSMEKYGSGSHYLWRHVFTIVVGLVAMGVLARIDYQKHRSAIYILLGISMVLLLLVFLPGIGIKVNGARRWIRLWPNTFQPSELVKVVMVVFLADYMDRNIHRMKEFRHGVLVPVGVMLSFQCVIILQPDFGSVMSLGILTVTLLLLGGASLKHIGGLVLLSLPAIYLLIASSAYRMKRIMCFTDPWKEQYDCGFQLVQSFIAFGSGNFFGVGLGGSKQKLYFLPEVHTDFIFSIIGEELGLLGVLAVCGLFIWFFVNGIKIASRTQDPFSYFLTLGLSLMIIIQAIINFAVSTGLLPTKGLPLPFISYGGSALLMNMAAVGVLVNISRKNEKGAMGNATYIDSPVHGPSYSNRLR